MTKPDTITLPGFTFLHSIPFYQIFFQYSIRPLAEFNTSVRFNSITYRKNHIQIVKFYVTIY